jgi:hypothetical protein
MQGSHTGKTMQWDMITDQWPWFSAAAVFVVFVGALAAHSFRKPKPHERSKSNAATQNGWMATGRIDFIDPQSIGDFILQVEETRIVDSVGGVEHREIRWRKAMLDEAKTVLVSYHAQRNLTMTANFIVSSPTVMRRNSDGRNEHQEIQLKQNGASAPHSESDAKISDTATDPGPTNVSHLTNPV